MFYGIIKNKAANIVSYLYDFYLKESFNDQREQADFISCAIKNLLNKGNFLSGGCDELVHPFNLIYECY
jgi:hypothetical protein